MIGEPAPRLSGQPVFGLPFDLHLACRRGPVVVAFLRPPGTVQANAAVARLHELWPELDAAGGSLVAVTRGDLDAVRDWVPREHILFPVLLDAGMCEAWGVEGDRAWRAVSRGAGPLRRVVSALRPGQAPIRPEDDQLPAEFVVGTDARIRYVERGRSVLHQPDLAALREALARP